MKFRSFSVLLALSGVSGCKGEPEAPEPTEPWRAQAVIESDQPRAQRSVVCDVKSDGLFQLRLPAKEATPVGSVGGLGGTFTIDWNDLRNTRGTILFDLTSLIVSSDDGTPDPERTQWGLDWLGLGRDVPPAARAPLRYGRFEVDALHDLSKTRLERHEGTKQPDVSARIQHVQAVAVGRLVMRNLSVARRIPIDVELDFGTSERRDALPEKILVRLRSAENVPLAEYGITPRSPAGSDQPTDRGLLGRVVGKSALVSGEIALLPRVR